VWYVETIIKVLTLAGKFVKEENISKLINLIAANTELQQ